MTGCSVLCKLQVAVAHPAIGKSDSGKHFYVKEGVGWGITGRQPCWGWAMCRAAWLTLTHSIAMGGMHQVYLCIEQVLHSSFCFKKAECSHISVIASTTCYNI